MSCPYYKSGYCTSPLLDQPTNAVVNAQRCFNSFRTCRYYVEKDEDKGLLQYTERETKEVTYYEQVNLLDQPVTSDCPFFGLSKKEGKYIARCVILNRVLTRCHAIKCQKYWNTCPFRNYFLTV